MKKLFYRALTKCTLVNNIGLTKPVIKKKSGLIFQISPRKSSLEYFPRKTIYKFDLKVLVK